MSKKNAEVVAVSVDKFQVIREASEADGRKFSSALNRLDTLLDSIVPTVHLAYTTGYVSTSGKPEDGQVSQTAYAKLFGVTGSTISAYRLYGAALAAGMDAKSPEYKALKVSKFAQNEAVAKAILAPSATADSITKASAKVKAAKSSKTPDKVTGSEKSNEDDAVALLVTVASALDLSTLTAKNVDKVLAAITVLTDKASEYMTGELSATA